MRPIRVLVIHGLEVLRAGIVSILGRDPGVHVVASAHSGERGLELVPEVNPDVVLTCHELPDTSGAELCERLRKEHPGVGVLIFSVDLHESVVRRSLFAGARGFLHVGIGASDLQRAVKAVARGDAVLDPAVAGRVMRWARHRSIDRGPRLSRRETEVLRLMSRGATDRRIASALGLSPNTVRTYLRRSLDKLGCNSRTEAAATVARQGL